MEGSRPDLLLLEFLAWIAEVPRTYEETMDVWRTTCPRSSAWEDAWMAGLISLSLSGDGRSKRTEKLTEAGRQLLEADRS